MGTDARALADLLGRSIGKSEYQMTAPVWILGMLQDEYGVDTAGVEHCTGGEKEFKLELPQRRHLPASIGRVSRHCEAAMLAYALLNLMAVRMMPVWLTLLGSGLDVKSILFVGWSGPRGIDSVLYLALVVQQFGTEHHAGVFSVIALTVLLSVLLRRAHFGRIRAERKGGQYSRGSRGACVQAPEHFPAYQRCRWHD